jgi:hypothetical protein
MEVQEELPFTASVLLEEEIGRRGAELPVIATPLHIWVSDF